ncbi:MAG: glycine betaine ABC transporter substrate-binding protein [Negativicutes bacterium]|nr:glycine betaine ABC transporter substrate-binding protein [Negativicutes bacterium]
MNNGIRFIAFTTALMLTAAIIAGCGQKAAAPQVPAKPKLVLASKPFAEQYILGHMAAELLKAKAGVDVDTSKIGMGPSELLHPAMEKGQIDIYPEYTGTAWMAILKQPVEYDKNVMYSKVKDLYAQKYGIEWLPSLGFQNTFALAVTKETAAGLSAKTISALAARSGLTLLGDATSFTRDDEYPGLKKVYGLDGKQKSVDVNFYYEGLKQKQADVALVFSTDGRLKQYDLTLLEDDKHFFPPYETAFLVRKDIAQKYPKVVETLNLLSGKISEATMTELNYQVEVEKKDPAEVAKKFLESQKLL